MKEKDEDWCEALLHRENYALVVDSISIESCLNAEAKCQLRTVGETLFTNYIALGLQKSNRFSLKHKILLFIILDSPYKPHFDKKLLTMTVDGTLQMLKERWTHDSECKDMVREHTSIPLSWLRGVSSCELLRLRHMKLYGTVDMQLELYPRVWFQVMFKC